MACRALSGLRAAIKQGSSMRFALTVALVIISTVASTGVLADWIKDSDHNTMVVLRGQAKFQPESVSSYGLTEFDGEIFDLKPNVYQRAQDQYRALLQEMQRRLAREKQPQVRQDLQILLQSLEDGLESAGLEHDMLLPYYNLHEKLFYSFHSLLDPRNERARFERALTRLRKYSGKDKGYSPITELAMARTAEAFGQSALLGPYRGELNTDLDNMPRYIAGIKSLLEGSGVVGWEADFALLEEQLDAYEQWLRRELAPRARQDHRLPAAIYADKLNNYGVRATPAELIVTGQYAYQFIRSEMQALARRIADQRGWDDHSLVPVLKRLKKDQIPQDKILEVYQQRLTAIEDIIRRQGIVTMPKRDASIRLATEAESAAIPAPFMSPPQLINNTGQYGEFVLVQTNPGLQGEAQMDDWSHYAITWALTVHEARPGHELQFAALVENGTSLARAIYAFNSANVEGWGLYAESIMHQYLPVEGQLFNLFTRLLRAARMFLDPMVNTGQLTPQQAANFLLEQLALSRPMANSEADRYAFRAPGQATAYYYGYMNLMRLRTELELALGDDFEQRAFHDFILQQGLLPPELLREAVLTKFTDSGK
jgi:hypothetical protein